MNLVWCGMTHICGRATNEDAFAMEQVAPGLAAFTVADGIGGLPAGEVASRTAVDALMESVRSQATEDGPCTAGRMKDMLDAGFLAAADAIARAVASDPAAGGMATTLVAALIGSGGAGMIAFSGDSRAYLAGADLVRITTDHSLVQEMVIRGIITQAAADVHPDRHVVTRVVGAAPVHPDFVPLELGDDTLLLCTDGLTDGLSGGEILAATRQPDPEGVCRALIDRAVQVNRDNTTVIVVRAIR